MLDCWLIWVFVCCELEGANGGFVFLCRLWDFGWWNNYEISSRWICRGFLRWIDSGFSLGTRESWMVVGECNEHLLRVVSLEEQMWCHWFLPCLVLVFDNVVDLEWLRAVSFPSVEGGIWFSLYEFGVSPFLWTGQDVVFVFELCSRVIYYFLFISWIVLTILKIASWCCCLWKGFLKCETENSEYLFNSITYMSSC